MHLRLKARRSQSHFHQWLPRPELLHPRRIRGVLLRVHLHLKARRFQFRFHQWLPRPQAIPADFLGRVLLKMILEVGLQ